MLGRFRGSEGVHAAGAPPAWHLQQGLGRTRRVANRDAAFGRSRDIDVVVTHSIVAVRGSTGVFQGLKQLLAPVLCELSYDTITLVPEKLLDCWYVQDCLWRSADLDTAVAGSQDL